MLFIFPDIFIQLQSRSPITFTFSPSKLLESVYQCFPLKYYILYLLPLSSCFGECSLCYLYMEPSGRASWLQQDILLKAFGHLSSVLQSSSITYAVKYTSMFVQNRINTFFVRRLADKMRKSKTSSQCWVKVKTHGRPVHALHALLANGERVSQIVEPKKSFAVSVTASATAKHTSVLSHLSPKRRWKERGKKSILPEWHNRNSL